MEKSLDFYGTSPKMQFEYFCHKRKYGLKYKGSSYKHGIHSIRYQLLPGICNQAKKKKKEKVNDTDKVTHRVVCTQLKSEIQAQMELILLTFLF